MNKMPSLKDVMLGKKPVVKEGASQSFNKPLTLGNVLNLAGSEIDELTKWKAGPGATKQYEPERAYSDEHDVLGPSGEPTGERFPTDAGTPTVDPERTADPNAKIPGHEFEESEGDSCPHCGAQMDHGDEGEMEDAEADDTLQYTGVDGDDVEEVGDHQPGAQGLEALGRSKGSAGWDPFGFDAKQNPEGGLVGGFKDLFKSKKAAPAPAPEGGFTGHADKMAYKDMMKMPKKQSGFGF